MSGEGNVCPGGITYRQHSNMPDARAHTHANIYRNTPNSYGKFQSTNNPACIIVSHLQLTAIRPNDTHTHIYDSTIDA